MQAHGTGEQTEQLDYSWKFRAMAQQILSSIERVVPDWVRSPPCWNGSR